MDTSFLCLEIPEFSDPFNLTLPGGITIERINIMEILQALLAPLVPFFEIIDTITAIVKCVQAIPDSLGPPPDPTVLAACLPDLAKKIEKLLSMIPALSLPLLLIQIIDLLIDTLLQVKREILYLQSQMVQILEAMDRASNLDDLKLTAIAQCAQANIAKETYNLGKMLASLGKLIGLVNLFMSMVGGPEIPDFSDLAGRPLDKVVAPLDALVKVLRSARNAVPVP